MKGKKQKLMNPTPSDPVPLTVVNYFPKHPAFTTFGLKFRFLDNYTPSPPLH